MRSLKILLFVLLFTCSLAFAKDSGIEIRWEFPSEHKATSVVCFTTRVFVAFSNGDVCALSMDNGSVYWKKSLSSGSDIQLAVKADSLYALDGVTLHKLDPATGKELRKKKLDIPEGKKTLATKPVVGKLLIQYPEKSFVVDAKSGRSIFSSDHPLFFDAPNVVLATRKWEDMIDEQRGVGYFIKGREIIALNLKTNKVEWKSTAPSELFGAPSSFKDIVIAVGPRVMYAVKKQDGTKAWIDDRFDDRKIVSPYLYFHTPKNRFTMMVDGGFLTHMALDKRRNFFYLMPDITRLMFTKKHETFFFFIYTEQKSGLWRSIVFRHSTKTAQLYGHDDVDGKSSGLFVKTDAHIYPELSFGTVYMLDRSECAISEKKKLSEKPFLWMDKVGHTAVVATAEGKLVGLSVK